jgi:hypothetical protein
MPPPRRRAPKRARRSRRGWRRRTPRRPTLPGRRPEPPSRKHVSRWRPRSAPRRTRWCSPPAAPRPTTSPSRGSSGLRVTGATTSRTSSPPRSSTRRCSNRRPGSRTGAKRPSRSSRPRPMAPSRWSDILEAVTDRTVLVSVMTANNELGAINDIAALGEALADRPAALHTDAVQAVATLDVDVRAWQLDALALSAHKIGGPQGVGVAVLRRGLPVEPSCTAGGRTAACARGPSRSVWTRRAAPRCTPQRRPDRRCDTAAGALGSPRGRVGRARRRTSQRTGRPERRLPSHVHVSIDGVDPTALSLALDRAGIAASSGAACGAGATKASHVLEATGIVGYTAAALPRLDLDGSRGRPRARRAR